MAIRMSYPHLPDRRRLEGYVDRIYDSAWLTNDGPLLRELEERLSEYLDVPHLLLVGNGTLALQVAYRTLGVDGTALTTPFSFVATASSLVWEGITPTFVDIDPATLNLDPALLERSLGEGTTAIVPVHVYGNPCDTTAIGDFAEEHGLKVVYDGAHAFGTTLSGRGIGRYGDATIYSFHATKLFHTVEGGAIAFADEAARDEARRSLSFGIDGPDVIRGLGINAKMHEFSAAMGLAVLDEIDEIFDIRRSVWETYLDRLEGPMAYPERSPDASLNYSYFPVLFEDEATTLAVIAALADIEVSTRRYFRPSLESLPYVESPVMPHSRSAAERVLCLPVHTEMSASDAARIAEVVNATVA